MSIYLSPFEHLKRILGGIYMESGFLDLLSTGQCTEDAYKPATLNYTTEIASYVSSTDTPLQGRVQEDQVSVLDETPFTGEALIDGSDSLAVGCINKSSEMIDPCLNEYFTTPIVDEPLTAILGNLVETTQAIDGTKVVVVTDNAGSITYVKNTDYAVFATGIKALSGGSIIDLQILLVDYTPGLYCSANIQAKKDTQEKIPSSMFSGKLRLFVQAIYGSTRDDYERDGFNLKIGTAGDASYPPFTLNRGFTNNSWLYTTANYDYFLCTFKGTSIEFRPIDLHTVAASFRDILKTHARVGEFTFATKLEAYILSTGQINTAIHSTITITGDTINGSPLDYGWHSKWDGHTATIVCFYDDVGNDQYLSDQHQITIGETWDGFNYTFTVANARLQSDMPWWPWTNTLNLFYYDENLQSMVPVELLPGTIGVSEGTFDSPIYNYYSLDGITGAETLSTVNIYMDITDTPANVNINLTADKYYSTDEHVYQQVIIYDGSVGNKGFKIGASSMNIDVYSTSFRTTDTAQFMSYQGMDATSVGAYGNGGNANTISDDAALSSYGYMTSLGLSPGETKEVGASTYHLKFIHYRFLWAIEQDQYLNGDSSHGEAFMQTMLGDCSNVVLCTSVLQSHSGRKVVQTGSFSKYLGGHLYWTKQPAFTVPPVTEAIGDMPGPVFVFPLPTYSGSGAGTETDTPADAGADEIDINENSGGAASPQTITNELILSEYLQPTTGDPKTGTIDTARASIENKYKITHAAFSTDGGFIYDTSIGWS